MIQFRITNSLLRTYILIAWFAEIGDIYMVEGWIKNLSKNKPFVRRIHVEMLARHLNMILQSFQSLSKSR